MEPNGLGGGLFSGMSTSGMLGLELTQNPSSNNSQNPPTHPPPPHHNNLHHHPQLLVPFNNHHEPTPDHHSGHLHQSQPPPPVKYPYSTTTTTKTKHSLALSDEDEPGLLHDDVTTSNDSKNRNISPWQRMKWTDTMVRLLIMAVFCIGDDQGGGGGATSSDVQLQIHNDPSNNNSNNGSKKKSSIGLLQKKGKWKSVSHAMLEKGFYVSPQQCEDKFNDLNKRYKRVNDILGKGTACRVVENQSLLDSMDNLTPKMKDEVRKLLNSKHLFFREMCAYHNSCGHNTTNTGPIAESTTSSQVRQQQIAPSTTQLQADQLCFHSLESNHHTAEEDEEEELDDYSEEDDEDDEEDEVEGTESRGHNSNIHHDQLDAYENEEKYSNCSRKRGRSKGVTMMSSLSMNQFSCEVIGVVQDGGKSGWEKKQWMKSKLIQLEEQQLGYQCQAFELEKQRMKWVKFSSKKERDMEKAKLENERRRLENERMVLFVRQKELELLEVVQQQQYQQQHSSNKRGDPSSIS